MWKILSFVFIASLVHSSKSFEIEIFNNETVKHLDKLQEELLKITSLVPDTVWILRSINHGFSKRNHNLQIPVDLEFNMTADKVNETNIFKFFDAKSLRVKSAGNKCNLDLIYMAFNFYKGWVIQMLDAAGKFPSGLSRGNMYWVGDFTQCRNVTVPLKVINNIHFGDFEGKYCSIIQNIVIQQFHLPIKIGICVPDSCNEEILLNDARNLALILQYIPVIKKIANYVNNTQITCQDSKRKWEASHIAYMCILCTFGAFMVVGTLCDIVIIYKKKRMAENKEDKSNENYNFEENIDTLINNDDEEIINSEVLCDREERVSQKENSESTFVQFLICFSMYSNGVKIFNTANSGNQLQCIHGIRFLSMCWIILGHTFLSSASFMENPLDFINYMKKFAAQLIIQATFAVDTFFLLSGLLLSYLFLKNYAGSNKKVNWIYYYLHRIWRLSPVLMMVLGFYTTVWIHMGIGPLWPKETENGHCRKYWWWNLLYIQNFKDISDMCMAWTWYLANDMQFYIISPLFLILLWKFPKIGFIVIYIVLGISSLITGILGTNNSANSIFNWMNANNESDISDLQANSQQFFNDLYDKPYCRIGPYLVGIATGYALHKMDDCKAFFTKKILFFCWIVAIGFSSSVMFGMYHAHLGVIGISIYIAFYRTTWSIAVAWVIFACLAGFGGIVNTILSWKVWIPLSRLTYSAYLIHPVIIGGFYSSLTKPYYFQLNSMIMHFFGFLITSYMVALIVSLAFESSMMALEKFILTKISKK